MTPTARRAARTTVVGLTSIAVAAFGTLALTTPASATPELEQVRERVKRVSEQVDELYREAGAANERLLKAQGELEDATQELTSSKGAVKQQTTELAEMTADMGGFAAASYRQGVLDPTLHLVLSDDVNEALNESVMLDAYAGQQASALAVVASERAALSAKQADVEEQTALLDDIEQEIEKEKKALDSKVETAESLLSSLKEEERDILAEVEAERQREEERRAEATERAARDAERDEPGQQGTQTDSSAPAPPPASGRAAAAVSFALAQIGDAYAYGGRGPNSWDCSGLTSGAWAAAGVSIPRTSQGQLYGLPRVSPSAVRPGDLVVYYSGASHVAVYIGNGQIVHASRPGRPVHVAPMYSMPMVGVVRPG